MADPKVTIERPRRRPRKGGFSSVVDFVQSDRLFAGTGVQFDADQCMLPVGEVQLCYVPDVGATDKEGEGTSWSEGIGVNFAGYVGVECFLHEGSSADFQDRARRGFEAGQDRFVEAQVWVWLAAATGLAAATSIASAIGKLEEHADANYVGAPILHISREDAVLATAAGALLGDKDGAGTLFTPHGTPVVASSAYASGTVAISGDMTGVQSELKVRSDVSHLTNRELAIAERAFNVAVDCGYREKITFA